jgi:hypothetical protein
MKKISLVMAFFVLSTSAVSSQTNEMESRFLSEAPVKWAELTNKSRENCGTYTETKCMMKDGAKQVQRKTTVEWKVIGDNAITLSRTYLSDAKVPSDEAVAGANSQYLFDISKKKTKSDWLLDSIVLNPTQGEDAGLDNPKHFPRTAYRRSLRHFFCCGEFITNLLADKVFQFKVVGNCATMKENPALVVIPFRFRCSTKKGQSFVEYCQGTLTLDSSRYWIINSYSAELTQRTLSPQGIEGPDQPDRAKLSVNYRYNNLDGMPVVASAVETHTYISSGNLPTITETVTEFQIHKVGDLNESEFRLTRFGLPEPIGATPPKANSLTKYFLLGGLGLLAIAIYFFSKMKATQKRIATSLP